MGRPSKLTDEQWAQIESRIVSGESARKLAKEFGVSDTAIRLRVTSHVEEIKSVANQMLEVESRLHSMPLTSQVTTHNLADQLRSISGHLASAANYGAATAHRLSSIAHGKVSKIADAAPLDEQGIETLKGIAVLTRMANASSEIGINLLRANKEVVDDLNRVEMNPEAASRKKLVKPGMAWVYDALGSDDDEEEGR